MNRWARLVPDNLEIDMKETTSIRVLAFVAAAVMNLAIATGLHLLAVDHQSVPTMAGDPHPAGQRLAANPARGG